MLMRYLLPILILISAGFGFYLLNSKDTLPQAMAPAALNGAQVPAGAPGNRPGLGNAGQRERPASAPDTETPDGATSAPADAQAATATPAARPPANQRRGGFGGFSGGGSNASAANSSIATVAVFPIQTSDWSPELNLFGSVTAFRQLDITSPVTAKVLALSVAEGDMVKTGQLLARLDPTDLLASQQQTQSRLTEMDAKIRLQQLQQQQDQQTLIIEQRLLAISQTAMDRIAGLAEQKLASSSDYEAAVKSHQNQVMVVQNREMSLARFPDTLLQLQAQRSELVATLSSLKKQLADTSIVAPFSGVVTELVVQQGQRVTANAKLVTLVDNSQMGLETRIPVKWLAAFSGSKINAIQTNNANQRLTLDLLGNQATLGSVKAVFRFEKPPVAAMGQHLAITAYLPPLASVYAIPAKMLYENRWVFRVAQGRLVDVPVTVAGQVVRDGETWYLIQGDALTAGLELLNTRLASATRGLQVTVRPNMGNGAKLPGAGS